MTTARRTLAIVVAIVLLALGGSGAALAAGQATEGTAAVAAPCDRLADRIAQLETAKVRVSEMIAQVEQRLDSLRPWQARAARIVLANLRNLLAQIDNRLAALQAQYAEGCTAEEDPPPAPGE